MDTNKTFLASLCSEFHLLANRDRLLSKFRSNKEIHLVGKYTNRNFFANMSLVALQTMEKDKHLNMIYSNKETH